MQCRRYCGICGTSQTAPAWLQGVFFVLDKLRPVVHRRLLQQCLAINVACSDGVKPAHHFPISGCPPWMVLPVMHWLHACAHRTLQPLVPQCYHLVQDPHVQKLVLLAAELIQTPEPEAA